MKRLLLGAVLLLVSGSSATAAASSTVYFQTPSKNIGCIYLGVDRYQKQPYLRCDIGGGLHPLPPRPKSCDLDWGYGYSMQGAYGRAHTFCAGDTAHDPRAPVLPYGRTWRGGPFTCLSRSIGLRCWNLARHGFFLSREHSYTF